MPGQALAQHDRALLIHPHRMHHALCDVHPEYTHLLFHGTRLLWRHGCIGLRDHCGSSKSIRTGAGPFHYDLLAYVFGRRQDTVFLELKSLLEPFGITRFYTDGWGTYERHIAPEQHVVGKQHTQTIESKHINLRTRIKRLV